MTNYSVIPLLCLVSDVEILSLTLTQPLPDSGSDEWHYIVNLRTNTEVTVQVPSEVRQQVVPQVQHESAPFRVQPSLRAFDANVSLSV